jgi:hypothetical protein
VEAGQWYDNDLRYLLHSPQGPRSKAELLASGEAGLGIALLPAIPGERERNDTDVPRLDVPGEGVDQQCRLRWCTPDAWIAYWLTYPHHARESLCSAPLLGAYFPENEDLGNDDRRYCVGGDPCRRDPTGQALFFRPVGIEQVTWLDWPLVQVKLL